MVSSVTRFVPRDIATQATSLLGGAKALGMKPRNSLDWVCLIRKGFPTSVLDSLGKNINVTDPELAQMLGISLRALAGRRRKKILSPYESERLLRTARVIARAEDVFDDLANGFAWLRDTNISLGHVTPISLLDTYVGADCVMDTLGRIEHGIVA